VAGTSNDPLGLNRAVRVQTEDHTPLTGVFGSRGTAERFAFCGPILPVDF